MAIIHALNITLVISCTAWGCTSVQHISRTDISYESVSSESTIPVDEDVSSLIAPYKEALEVKMNEVIGNVAQEMTKKKPESTLGNWYVDALVAWAHKEGHEVDLAISNYGGLRIPYLSAGPLTRGEIYELCPFDNLLVIVDVPGNILDSLLHEIAQAGGWPISNTVRMSIKNNHLVNCTINNQHVNTVDTYKIAMPDYIANGGDGLKILIPLSRMQTGKLIRDILIEYAQETKRNGKEISAVIEGRIVYH